MLFPPPPPPPGAPPTVSRREQFRLVALALVALAITLSLAWTWGRGRAPAPAPATPATGVPGDGGAPIPGSPVDVTPVPLFPEEEAREVEAALMERLRTFHGIRDGEVADDPESWRFLVEEVTRNYRVINLRPEGFDAPGDLSALLADPAPARGRLLEVQGELVALDRGPGPEGDTLVREVRRGVLKDAAGNWYSFSRPVVNPLEPDAVDRAGAWLRIRGILYRSVPVPDPAAPTTLRPTLHLVLTESPLADYPPVTVREIAPEWYAAVRDATPAEAAVRDEPPFYLLLNLLANLGPEGFEAWGRAQQARVPDARWWPPEDFTSRAGDLMRASATQRFRPVAYTGVLKRPQWLYDLRPNPGNVERLWVGFLVSDDFLPVWVYSTRSFVDMGFKDGDRVRMDGLYYKRTVFLPKSGKETLQAPVLLLARMRAAPLPDTLVSRDVFLVMAAVTALMAFALVVTIVQGRRETRAEETRRRDKARRKREKAAAAGAAAATDAAAADGEDGGA